jgi:hypothetical protein
MTKMDSLGMGLGAARDELATLQLTELHPLPKPWSGKDSGLASPKSGLAALRDFDAAFDRFGRLEPVEVLQLEQIAEKLSSAFGDNHHVRLGDALQARRKVWRLADLRRANATGKDEGRQLRRLDQGLNIATVPAARAADISPS